MFLLLNLNMYLLVQEVSDNQRLMSGIEYHRTENDRFRCSTSNGMEQAFII